MSLSGRLFLYLKKLKWKTNEKIGRWNDKEELYLKTKVN
jgi:hypothetical protein